MKLELGWLLPIGALIWIFTPYNGVGQILMAIPLVFLGFVLLVVGYAVFVRGVPFNVTHRDGRVTSHRFRG